MSNQSEPHRLTKFHFWDAVSIIVGIVVGTAIFKSPTMVFQNATSAWQAIGFWGIGGLLSLCGAFCYAELGAAYPHNGGDYAYLNRAFGNWLGFLFGWAQFAAILSGSIAAMSYAFGDYAVRLFGFPETSAVALAAVAVTFVSVVNLRGVVVGKQAQNWLSLAKVLGLLAVLLAALLVMLGRSEPLAADTDSMNRLMGPGAGLAMVFVLYAFGGWNDAVYVAAEVRDPTRNLPRALVLGILGITTIYLLVNLAYLAALGFAAARQTHAPAADVLRLALGPWGERVVSALVMVSALGAINGMVLTGSRIYAELGTDYRVFGWLGKWNPHARVPVNAILGQGAVALLMIVAVGTEIGRQAIDRGLAFGGLQPMPWGAYFGGFETLVASTAPIFWLFFLLTGVALVVLRFRDPQTPRPFRVPFYPLPVILFCATCAYMLWSSLAYARWLSLVSLLPFVTALPFGILHWRHQRSRLAAEPTKGS